MRINYPTYYGNYPKSTRKIKKQYISYRGRINTQKINAQFVNFQYESPLERDFIQILVHDLYCQEIVPQAQFNIPNDKNKLQTYSVDVWALYFFNKKWYVYLYEVKPEEKLNVLEKNDENWNTRINALKEHCKTMNDHLRNINLNVEWKLKIITEKHIYSVRFANISIFFDDSLKKFESHYLRKIIESISILLENNDQVSYFDLLSNLNKKFGNNTYSVYLLNKSILNFLIYNQILWIDWERKFIESESLISFNKSQSIKLRPSFDIIPQYFEKELYQSKIVSMPLDLNKIDNNLIDKAKNRLSIIKPLIEKQESDLLTAKQIEEIANNEGVSYSTIYNWMRIYKNNNNDFRSLIPKNYKRGSINKKINEDVEKIIQFHITNNCECCKVSVAKIVYYNNIKAHCESLNLRPPNIKTVKNRIDHLPAKERKGKQGGFIKYEIQKSITGEFERGEYPLHFVQVDSTWLDIFVIDEFDGRSKRPFITTYVDVKTRMLYSYWLTLREHNAVDVNRGLMRGILPKTDLLKQFGISASYPIYGIPHRIQFDNGKIFDTEYVQDFAFRYGIADYQFRMIKRPDTGTFVERLNRTINEKWLSVLDGYAPPIKRRPNEYNPQKHKNLLSFNDFQKWFLLRVIQYHNEEHKGLFKDTMETHTPQSYYYHSMKGREPILPNNYSQMNIDVLHFKKSVLNAEGIKFVHNNYNNDGINPKGKKNNYLAKIRLANRGEKKMVFWRYDPEDIREIWVYNEWVEKPFYFSVKFSTGLLKHFMSRYPDIPIPLRIYNSTRNKLRKEGEHRENNAIVIAKHLENKLINQNRKDLSDKTQFQRYKELTAKTSIKSTPIKDRNNLESKEYSNKVIDWEKLKSNPMQSWSMK